MCCATPLQCMSVQNQVCVCARVCSAAHIRVYGLQPVPVVSCGQTALTQLFWTSAWLAACEETVLIVLGGACCSMYLEVLHLCASLELHACMQRGVCGPDAMLGKSLLLNVLGGAALVHTLSCMHACRGESVARKPGCTMWAGDCAACRTAARAYHTPLSVITTAWGLQRPWQTHARMRVGPCMPDNVLQQIPESAVQHTC